MSDLTPEDFEQIRQHTRTAFRFVENTGVDLLEYGRGMTKLMMPLEGNVNHVGMMYAGALFTLAEIPGGTLFGSAFDTTRFYPIVGELSIRYKKPAMGDAFVTARMSDDEIDQITATLEEKGRAKYVLELEITDADGDVLATTSGTYFGLSF